MLKWPLTTRGRLDDAQLTIARLERELSELKQERRRLTDFITVKSAGMSVYNEIQPVRDPDEEEDRPRKYSPEKDSAEPMLPVRPIDEPYVGPRSARDVARKAEKQNLAQADHEHAELRRLVVGEEERIRSMARAELAESVNAGIRAAENR